MKVNLIDLDNGPWPNLALMKLSASHKAQGDDVMLNYPLRKADKTYASCVFTKNRSRVSELDGQAVIGGSGYDLSVRLPPEIEKIRPDYRLYGIDYSLGFTSRGCLRKCPWCIVPQKEGKLRPVASIYDIWEPGHKKIVLLDSNILGLPEHFRRVCEELTEENLIVDFNAGLDIRLINEANARLLRDLTIVPYPRFAWDHPSDERAVRKGIDILRRAGFGELMFYVLVNFNTTWQEDMHRVLTLRDLRCSPYVMIYGEASRLIREFRTWVLFKRFFKTHTFEKFLKIRGLSLAALLIVHKIFYCNLKEGKG